jgi:hypothetical protein
MMSMIIMYLGGFLNASDYRVYSLNTAELDKLFQNLTPEYLGSKDFENKGDAESLGNTSNLSNIPSDDGKV